MPQWPYVRLVVLGWASACTAVFAAEYHVATNGTDVAAGTPRAPFRTIQRAADAMQPGDSCVVHGGVYREWVKPPRGGESEQKQITFKAAPGEQVVLKGSERVTGWTKLDGIWRVELPGDFFGTNNPFRRCLAGEWLHYGTNRHLGMIFLEGAALVEKLAREEVPATSMSWYVEPAKSTAGKTVLWANFGSANPNSQLTEATVRESIFFPAVKGLKYITVDGFTFCQAAPQWAYWNAYEEAAVGTYFGYRWVIRNCRFTDVRCVALVCGNDAHKPNEGQDLREVGQHVVRRNYFARCGEAALHGNWGWAGSLIEGNLIEDINPRNEFGGMETGGMKIHYAVDVTVKGNVVRRVFGRKPPGYTYKWGPEFAAIWIDWGAQGTRVTGNIVYDTEALALFLQNSHGSPVLVDNNIFSGALRLNTEGVVYAHNLFVNGAWKISAGAAGPFWKPHSGTLAGSGPIPKAHVKWWNNIFIGQGLEKISQETGFASDWNCFFAGAQKTSWGDNHSLLGSADAQVRFSDLPEGVRVECATTSPRDLNTPSITRDFAGQFALTGQGLEDAQGRPISLDQDLLGHARATAHPRPGPFESPSNSPHTITVTAGCPGPIGQHIDR